MASSPEVLLLDDGELDDVQGILDAMGASYGRVRGAAIPGRMPAPRRLLVTTPRRLDAVPMPAEEGDEVVRIVVVHEDSPTLREKLREVGFDYLVRRPVHPEALRLLLLRALYRGSERRSEVRVPVGFEVSYRSGLFPKRAVLADLSTRGCRILSRWPTEPGKRLTIALPHPDGDAKLSVRGRVVRMSLDERLAPAGPYSAAVEFEPLHESLRLALESLLEESARGPASLHAELLSAGTAVPGARPVADAQAGHPHEPLDAPETRASDLAHDLGFSVDVSFDPDCADEEPLDFAHPIDAPADDESGTVERRDGPRAAYARRVPAFGERAMRVLVARDLSMGGMRIQADEDLSLGDRLHLAIYGAADEEPFLVWATVDRDDGDRGLVLVFDELPAALEDQLESVVVNLPAVESLRDDEIHAMGTVVSEILPR